MRRRSGFPMPNIRIFSMGNRNASKFSSVLKYPSSTFQTRFFSHHLVQNVFQTQTPRLNLSNPAIYTGMECAYSWHFFIFSLGSCRVVKQSFVLLNPNDFYRNECTSVCPHLNHTFFIKLEPGFEPSDAFLRSTSEPYSTL